MLHASTLVNETHHETRLDSNRPAPQSKLAGVLKFGYSNDRKYTILEANNKDADQTARMADAQADLCFCCSHMT